MALKEGTWYSFDEKAVAEIHSNHLKVNDPMEKNGSVRLLFAVKDKAPVSGNTLAFGRLVFFEPEGDKTDYILSLEGYQGNWPVSHVMLLPSVPK